MMSHTRASAAKSKVTIPIKNTSNSSQKPIETIEDERQNWGLQQQETLLLEHQITGFERADTLLDPWRQHSEQINQQQNRELISGQLATGAAIASSAEALDKVPSVTQIKILEGSSNNVSNYDKSNVGITKVKVPPEQLNTSNASIMQSEAEWFQKSSKMQAIGDTSDIIFGNQASMRSKKNFTKNSSTSLNKLQIKERRKSNNQSPSRDQRQVGGKSHNMFRHNEQFQKYQDDLRQVFINQQQNNNRAISTSIPRKRRERYIYINDNSQGIHLKLAASEASQVKFGQIEPQVVKLKLEPKTAVKNRRDLSFAASCANKSIEPEFQRESNFFKPGKMVKLNQNTTKNTTFHNNRSRVGVAGVKVDLKPKNIGAFHKVSHKRYSVAKGVRNQDVYGDQKKQNQEETSKSKPQMQDVSIDDQADFDVYMAEEDKYHDPVKREINVITDQQQSNKKVSAGTLYDTLTMSPEKVKKMDLGEDYNSVHKEPSTLKHSYVNNSAIFNQQTVNVIPDISFSSHDSPDLRSKSKIAISRRSPTQDSNTNSQPENSSPGIQSPAMFARNLQIAPVTVDDLFNPNDAYEATPTPLESKLMVSQFNKIEVAPSRKSESVATNSAKRRKQQSQSQAQVRKKQQSERKMTVEVATFELAPQDKQVRENLKRSLLKSPPMPTEQRILNQQQFQVHQLKPIMSGARHNKTNSNILSGNKTFMPEMTMQIKAYELSLNDTTSPSVDKRSHSQGSSKMRPRQSSIRKTVDQAGSNAGKMNINKSNSGLLQGGKLQLEMKNRYMLNIQPQRGAMGDYSHDEAAFQPLESQGDQVKFKHTISSLDAADETDEVNNDNDVQTNTLDIAKGLSTHTQNIQHTDEVLDNIFESSQTLKIPAQQEPATTTTLLNSMELTMQNIKDNTQKNSSTENNTAQNQNSKTATEVFKSAFGKMMKTKMQDHMQKLTKAKTKLPNNDNKDIMTKQPSARNEEEDSQIASERIETQKVRNDTTRNPHDSDYEQISLINETVHAHNRSQDQKKNKLIKRDKTESSFSPNRRQDGAHGGRRSVFQRSSNKDHFSEAQASDYIKSIGDSDKGVEIKNKEPEDYEQVEGFAKMNLFHQNKIKTLKNRLKSQAYLDDIKYQMQLRKVEESKRTTTVPRLMNSQKEYMAHIKDVWKRTTNNSTANKSPHFNSAKNRDLNLSEQGKEIRSITLHPYRSVVNSSNDGELDFSSVDSMPRKRQSDSSTNNKVQLQTLTNPHMVVSTQNKINIRNTNLEPSSLTPSENLAMKLEKRKQKLKSAGKVGLGNIQTENQEISRVSTANADQKKHMIYFDTFEVKPRSNQSSLNELPLSSIDQESDQTVMQSNSALEKRLLVNAKIQNIIKNRIQKKKLDQQNNPKINDQKAATVDHSMEVVITNKLVNKGKKKGEQDPDHGGYSDLNDEPKQVQVYSVYNSREQLIRPQTIQETTPKQKALNSLGRVIIRQGTNSVKQMVNSSSRVVSASTGVHQHKYRLLYQNSYKKSDEDAVTLEKTFHDSQSNLEQNNIVSFEFDQKTHSQETPQEKYHGTSLQNDYHDITVVTRKRVRPPEQMSNLHRQLQNMTADQRASSVPDMQLLSQGRIDVQSMKILNGMPAQPQINLKRYNSKMEWLKDKKALRQNLSGSKHHDHSYQVKKQDRMLQSEQQQRRLRSRQTLQTNFNQDLQVKYSGSGVQQIPNRKDVGVDCQTQTKEVGTAAVSSFDNQQQNHQKQKFELCQLQPQTKLPPNRVETLEPISNNPELQQFVIEHQDSLYAVKNKQAKPVSVDQKRGSKQFTTLEQLSQDEKLGLASIIEKRRSTKKLNQEQLSVEKDLERMTGQKPPIIPSHTPELFSCEQSEEQDGSFRQLQVVIRREKQNAIIAELTSTVTAAIAPQSPDYTSCGFFGTPNQALSSEERL